MDSFNDLMRIQRQMASRIVHESDTDLKIKLMDIINNLVTDKNKKIHTEKIIFEARMEGISEEEIIRTIDELIDLGMLISPESGFIKRG